MTCHSSTLTLSFQLLSSTSHLLITQDAEPCYTMSKRSQPDQPPSKRARFASPPNPAVSSRHTRADDLPESDFLESDLSNVSSAKKRRDADRSLKDAEGYASDSTEDEEEGVVPSRKTGHGEDEDEDMFGGVAEEEDDTATGKEWNDKGKKRMGRGSDEKGGYMNLGDIEGQDFGHSSGKTRGDEMDADDDDDDSDGERERRRTKRAIDDPDYDSEDEKLAESQGKGLDGPMGVPLTAFNMKAELRSGKMTADGETYMENDKDPHEAYDRWLEEGGEDKAGMRKARRAKRERERLEREREEKEEREEKDLQENGTGHGRLDREREIMGEMIELLERGETVLEGLQRLGKELEKERKKLEEKESREKGKKKLSWAEKQRERKAILQGNTASEMQVE